MTDLLKRIRRIKRYGYQYRESAPFYVWDGRLKAPCGHPIEGLAKLKRLLLKKPHMYATGCQRP